MKIYEKNFDKIFLAVNKQIIKEGNQIIEKNIMTIDKKYNFSTNWEDIESQYMINKKYYICPKGKNFINVYNSNGTFEKIIGRQGIFIPCYYVIVKLTKVCYLQLF